MSETNTIIAFKNIPVMPEEELVPFSQENSDYLFGMRGYTIESWVDAYKKMGAVFKTTIYDKEEVVLAGIAANESAWRSPDDWSYHDAVAVFREELSALHLTQLDREAHRRKRRLLNPAFKPTSIMQDFPVMAQIIEDGVDAIVGQEIESHEALMKIFTKAQAATAVKVDLSDDEIEQMVEFEEGFIGALFIPKEDRLKIYNRSSYLETKQAVLQRLEKIVAERMDGAEANDRLDAIIHQKVSSNLEPLSVEELLYDTYLMLIAGTGNTGKVITFLLYYLDQNPTLKKELAAELAHYDAMQLAQGMDAFPLLKATLMEAERMFPPSPALPRVPYQDITFLDHELPTGTSCLHLVGLMHFCDEVYEDPASFRPQRWIENSYPKNAHGLYGGGKHTCLGMHVARLQMPLTIAHILKNYDFTVHSVPRYESYRDQEGPDAQTVRMHITFSKKSTL